VKYITTQHKKDYSLKHPSPWGYKKVQTCRKEDKTAPTGTSKIFLNEIWVLQCLFQF